MVRNQTVLITGASSGIGYELAQLFARDQYNLVLVARSKAKLEELKRELEKEIQVTIIAQDLTQPQAASEVYRILQEEQIEIDILVNNAGYGLHGHFADLDLEQQVNMIQLNMLVLTQLTHLLLQGMLDQFYQGDGENRAFI